MILPCALTAKGTGPPKQADQDGGTGCQKSGPEQVPASSTGPKIAGPGCTRFQVNLTSGFLKLILDMGCRNACAGPKPGLWDCNPSDSGSLFNVKEKPGTLPQLRSLQGADSSNPMCLGRVGLARPVDTPMSLIAPALTAISQATPAPSGREVWPCTNARHALRAGCLLPFGNWLSKQTPDLCLALFSIFPVHSDQAQRLSQIVDFAGADQIAALGMEHFVINLTYLNRWQNITQARRRA